MGRQNPTRPEGAINPSVGIALERSQRLGIFEPMTGTGTSELKVRYSYRLRLSNRSERKLLAEWDRCRFVWNYCVARSKEHNSGGEQCGPAMLDKELTLLRSQRSWLKEGSSVAQQQTIRDFGAARAKAIKDIINKVPMTGRRGFPKFKKKSLALPSITPEGVSLSKTVGSI